MPAIKLSSLVYSINALSNIEKEANQKIEDMERPFSNPDYEWLVEVSAKCHVIRGALIKLLPSEDHVEVRVVEE